MTSIDSAARAETVLPPKILDLEWQPTPGKPGHWHAERTYDFNFAEMYVQHEILPPYCINPDYHRVEFKSELLSEGPYEPYIAALEQKIINRTLREKAERKFEHDIEGSGHREAVTDAIAEAQALYDEYGAACRDIKETLHLIELRYLSLSELRRLQRIVGKTTSTIAHMDNIAAKISPKPYPLLLDDDFVERGVLKLTSLDRDRHRIPNGEGWSPKTSACGHWCAAMITKDREKALRVGRVLVSHHIGQLRKLGIVPAAVSSRRAA